ncbi:hypothetical protein OQA88_9714 [Cercophora sp. LCS_1]
MPLTTALRRAALRPPACQYPLRYLSTTRPRRVAMADGGRAADDIDLAFDYPSEMQATYTTPSGVHQQRLDKEMGYPDQRLLYATVVGVGLAGLYGALSSNSSGPPDRARSVTPQSDATGANAAGERNASDTGL